MPRYIDADALHKKIYPLDLVDKRNYSINAKAVEKAIFEMPTADVAEVVRCKDCKWWEARTHGSTIGRCENPLNGLYNEYSDFADFCSYGERKE